MSTEIEYKEALGRLKGVLRASKEQEFLKGLIEPKDEVLARYQEVFTPDGISQLQTEDFRNFLMFRNNKHWTGLQRLGPWILKDLTALREALLELINEDVAVEKRLDSLLPGGKARVTRLGKAVLTPVLLITQPEKYGVWNGTSEGAMKKLDLWPDFERGLSIGKKYKILNELMKRVAQDLDVDLWTLDALWWGVLKMEEEELEEEPSVDEEVIDIRFGLERHLHDFLLDNWDNTSLGKDWGLVEEGGDIKGYGYERVTDVGKIDLLAKHHKEPRWLVIELKRGQSSDQTVGQVLRYMGWVQEQVAEEGETVEGLIISLSDSQKLRYALKMTTGIKFMRYEVEFRLLEGEAE